MSEQVFPAYTVAESPSNVRSEFIRKTYSHLALAIFMFVFIEWLLLDPLRESTRPLIEKMVSGRFSWLIVLGLFMAVGWIADRWAQSSQSKGMQYLGLSLYVVAEAIIFLPLLYVAAYLTDSSVLPTAAIITLGLFVGLTAVVFITRKDFSFMRTALTVGGFVALGIIVCALLFGFELGTLFSSAMIVLAGGYILYYTSNVLHHYHPGQHVAASLALFAAVALMFWYVLRLLMALSRD
jgi:FtsH-binding integral membrane protein